MLIERITEDMKQAMKSGNKLQLGAIRMLRAAIQDKQIELGRKLDDPDVHALLAKMVKQRRDAAIQYAAGGRGDLETRELAEIDYLQAYQPKQLGEQELVAVINQTISEIEAKNMRDMGKVMGALKTRIQGRADMGKVHAMVKERLASA